MADTPYLVSTNEIVRYLIGAGIVTDQGDRDAPRFEYRLLLDDVHALLDKRKIKHEDWSPARCIVAVQQLMFRDTGADPGGIDGLVGPQTLYALERWQDLVRDVEVPKKVVKFTGKPVWPRENGLLKFYGSMGSGLILLELPYPMRLAWDLDNEVTKISIHNKCADSAYRVLERVKKEYPKRDITRLGFDIFGGCIANPPRFKRGSKSSPSTHNWGIALDFDPLRNQLRWGSDRASLARTACLGFWEAWEDEGWVSLGRERNYDWMHVQAAAL